MAAYSVACCTDMTMKEAIQLCKKKDVEELNK